jgi:hypothetical protein
MNIMMQLYILNILKLYIKVTTYIILPVWYPSNKQRKTVNIWDLWVAYLNLIYNLKTLLKYVRNV